MLRGVLLSRRLIVGNRECMSGGHIFGQDEPLCASAVFGLSQGLVLRRGIDGAVALPRRLILGIQQHANRDRGQRVASVCDVPSGPRVRDGRDKRLAVRRRDALGIGRIDMPGVRGRALLWLQHDGHKHHVYRGRRLVER